MNDMCKPRICAGIVEKALVLNNPRVSEPFSRAAERRQKEMASAELWRAPRPEDYWRECGRARQLF